MRPELSLQEQKQLFFPALGEFSAPGTIGLIGCIRGIRVPLLNLDA